ncbi:hypothetical protein [Porphyromonas sp.]|uniref:hypothetical protein n=1 Tax=Porphyromonas sp. TaxID=1924944 RepID=UPI0026DDA7B7|nr:hypothetical protein [Porphyromonas sp.]MDO4770602.1 hypothetical protein [Porphyromonas sp.]
MKRFLTAGLLIASLFAPAALSANEASVCAPDTTVRVKDKLITLHEKGQRFNVTVRRINAEGDTINARQIFRGTYDLGRREEQTFSFDKIRIPFVTRERKGKNKKSYRVDISGLGFGFSRFQFSGNLDHLNTTGSHRFMLGLFAINYKQKAMTFTLGTSFDFNKIHLLDDYTLRRDATGKTVETAPLAGEAFGKDRLSATYFNMYGRFTLRPIPGLSNFYIYGYAAGKILTASSMKAWSRTTGRENFDGNKNLRNFLPEVGGGIGYGWLGLQILYTPQSLFLSDKGPDLRMTTIGVTLGF